MCRKKLDIVSVEFLDQCKDGLIDLVNKTLTDSMDPVKLLKSFDDDKKTGLHLVRKSYF